MNDLVTKQNQDLTQMSDNIKIELNDSNVSIPENYSIENAMKSAYLILTEKDPKTRKSIVETCSPSSVYGSLLDMSVQGLNPIKKQCYFIGYGGTCKMQRSYMGSVAVAKRVNPMISDIRAIVIYKGDNLKFETIAGKHKINSHTQTFESMVSAEIVGAYAVAVDNDDNQLHVDIMTIDQIKKSWLQTTRKDKPVTISGVIDKTSTHGKFTEEMVKKTIYNRICKMIINTSDDNELLNSSMRTDEETPTAVIIQKEIDENANQKLIDFPVVPAKTEDDFIEQEAVATQIETEMANTAQARAIIKLEKASNRTKDDTLKSISGFVGRQVDRLRELTKHEANEYLDMLNEEIANNKPDWGC